MTLRRRELYESSNGDRWYLAASAEPGDVFVEHVPNAPSGGQVSRVEVGAFLRRGPHGPEHRELLRLIATLVDEDAAGV